MRDKPDLTNKCYKTKDDKLHNTIYYRGGMESAEDREERLKNLREFSGKWVIDPKTRKLVRAEECEEIKDVGLPNPSLWNPEWTVIATGRRMSKGELKRYCRARGKIWENQ